LQFVGHEVSVIQRAMGVQKYRHAALLSCLTLLFGCATLESPPPVPEEPDRATATIGAVGYTIQVGAFSVQDNAVRYTDALQRKGLNAYHFIDASGFYKVRFGNYPSRQAALQDAETLQTGGLIEDYYIVRPERPILEEDLRKQILLTARSFLGIPYKWGGVSAEDGFDCSGLTMTVYQLNGLDLPRTSRQQWQIGTPVPRRELSKGDLVFFATAGGGRVSHVGIYVGSGRFIHAPGRGKKIRYASLSKPYYQHRFLGGRRYL
jgi:hypothetical protein